MPEKTTIAAAALKTGRSYNQMMRLVLLGLVRGEQTANGRWLVDAGDVERLATGEADHAPRRRQSRRAARA